MPFDFTLAMIQATVAVAAAPTGVTTIGTGILVSDPMSDGTPRVVLVTARHLMEGIGAQPAQVGVHLKTADGGWRRAWLAEPSGDGDKSRWAAHPVYDVAVLPVIVPPEVAAAAIPISWFADGDTFARQDVEPGDALEVLGYPDGLSADPQGFAILRVGHLASYPLTPQTDGTFLVDFAVEPGNSGGPVFTSRRTGRGPVIVGAQGPQPDEFVAGVLAQQIVPGGRSIQLGRVVHALYVRQTLELLDHPPAPPQQVAPSTTNSPPP